MKREKEERSKVELKGFKDERWEVDKGGVEWKLDDASRVSWSVNTFNTKLYSVFSIQFSITSNYVVVIYSARDALNGLT